MNVDFETTKTVVIHMDLSLEDFENLVQAVGIAESVGPNTESWTKEFLYEAREVLRKAQS